MAEIKNIQGALTEQGNLKRDVQNQLREKAVDKFLGDFEKTPKGDYVLHIADADGKPVYLRATMSVSTSATIFDQPKVKVKENTDAATIDLGSIFD